MGLLSGPRDHRGRAVHGAQARATQYWGIGGPNDLIPRRSLQNPNRPHVTNDTALRHSAVWACLRLRADLISTLPVDVLRDVAGMPVAAIKPPVLSAPGGERVNWLEWMYSTQFDLDRAGNTVGIITAVDGFGFPKAIELQAIAEVTIKVKDGRISKFKIANTLYDPEQIWHEKQYTVAGMHVGLSPIQYAAWEIGQYLTVQQFATDWFAAAAVPKAKLKNKAKVLTSGEIATVKEAWHAAMVTDEPFVTGSDWDYEMIQAQQASQDWLESKRFSVTDVCRFMGVPSELVDSAPTGESRPFTYANISQKNLEFLIMNLGPPIARRERALSDGLLPAPRYLKLNADALMRLDPISRAAVIQQQIASKTLTPDEGRAIEGRPPLTSADIAQLDHFFPPVGGAGGGGSDGGGQDAGDQASDPGYNDGAQSSKTLPGRVLREIEASPWSAGPQFGRREIANATGGNYPDAGQISVADAALGLLNN